MEGSVHVRVTVKVLINLQCFCDPPSPLKSMKHLGCVNLRRRFGESIIMYYSFYNDSI